MDKQYYTTKQSKYQELRKEIKKFQKILSKKLEESRVIKRRRKVKNTAILTIAICKLLSESLSFRALSEYMAVEYKIEMSDTAWEKQLSKCAAAFCEASKEITEIQVKSKEICLIDATNVPIEGANNGTMRLHCSYDLSRQDIDEAHISDWHTGESICNFNIHPGALYIADRAYGKAKQMAYILCHHANFLFRITPHNIRLYTDPACKIAVNLLELLQNTKGNSFETLCYFKYCRSGYPVHLKCFRIPEEKLDAVERRTKAVETKKCHKFSDKTKYFNKWVLLCTSLSEPSYDLFELYAKRWQIELLFKRSKIAFRFHRIRRGSQKFYSMIMRFWLSFVLLASHFASSSPFFIFDSFALFPLFFS